MEVVNQLYPVDPEQKKGFFEEGPKGPIYMINLLKFKDKAVYPDGRETNLSGREAYGLYAKEAMRLVGQYGGKLVFVADVSFLTIGQVEDLWDEVAIVAYPDRAALREMSTSAEWQAAAIHRQAGLQGQLNIESTMPAMGTPDVLQEAMKDVVRA